jgi:hypothetical protein
MATFLCRVDGERPVVNHGVCIALPRSFAYLSGITKVELRRPDGSVTQTEMMGCISFFTGDLGFGIKTEEAVPDGTEVSLL